VSWYDTQPSPFPQPESVALTSTTRPGPSASIEPVPP